MGFYKVILCLNDADHEIDGDAAGWWQACKAAFYKLSAKRCDPKTYVRQPESFGHGNHSNYWSAVFEAHATTSAVIIVGGNNATVLGCSGDWNHSEEDYQIRILKDVLERKGYTISKKSSRIKKPKMYPGLKEANERANQRLREMDAGATKHRTRKSEGGNCEGKQF